MGTIYLLSTKIIDYDSVFIGTSENEMACIQEDIATDSYGRKKAHTSWRGANVYLSLRFFVLRREK